MNSDKTEKNNNSEESVPLFKSWKIWYWVVAVNLVFLISIFYWFTKAFE